eukprot:1026730-Ditylum_brightwellii.AAC.1
MLVLEVASNVHELKHARVETTPKTKTMDLTDDFFRRTGLDAAHDLGIRAEALEQRHEPCMETQDPDRFTTIEKEVSHLSDTLAALKDQRRSENVVIEMGRQIFKGKKDMEAWMETYLPN